jgi:SAM-dependent methyltransferase
MQALGAALRYRGLAPRALAAWATPRLSALPHLLPSLPPAEGTTAGALLELFVAGRAMPVDRLHAVDLDALHRAELVDVAGGEARARVALLPLGGSLLVCDRLDAPAERELACWPDDSSYHLALSLPSRLSASARWLDLGCGSGFAQLLRPELAYERVGSDLNARALAYARLGGELSDVALAMHDSDLGETVPRGPYELVTCNAPIPDGARDPYRPMWHETNSDFVARLFEHAARLVAPLGMVVVHAAEDALVPIVDELRGERVMIAYTPPGVRGFAVAWWRPDAEPRLVSARRELTAQRPHVTFADYEATAR